jgi:lipid-binding SYLF domain-containing protein
MKNIALILLFSLPGLLPAEATPKRLNSAAGVLGEIMSTPDKGIPLDLMRHAECVVVIPAVKQGAFGVGAKYGKGFFSCRKGADWSAPGSIRIEGGSVGFQIGANETDVVLLVLNRRGAERLLSTQFTVGGEAEAAAGPVGRSSTAQTDASMRAEILSWSRSRGAFAGVSLQGATLRQDENDNADIYGRKLTNKEVINGPTAWPNEGSELHAVLRKYASLASQHRARRRRVSSSRSS